MQKVNDGSKPISLECKKISRPSALNRLYRVYKDPERKSIPRILTEVVCLAVVKRSFPPSFYMSRFLFKKSRKNIFDFFPYSYFARINRFFNDDEARSVLENKLFTHFFYSRFNVAMPVLLAFNHRRTFVAGNTAREIANPDEFRNFLKELLSEMPEHESVFIKKTWGSFGGDCVFRLEKKQLSLDSYDLKSLYDRLVSSDYIFQERLKQHPLLESINASSVNTVRIDTFIDKDGNSEVMSAYLRTGLNGSHVDNITAGGLEVPIDIETGRLHNYGFMGSAENLTIRPDRHPDTQKEFMDTTIPFFDDVKRLVCRMALLIPELRLIGWDIAIGETGPVLIEGNTNYDMTGGDLNYGGYRRNPVFKKAIEEYKGRKGR